VQIELFPAVSSNPCAPWVRVLGRSINFRNSAKHGSGLYNAKMRPLASCTRRFFPGLLSFFFLLPCAIPYSSAQSSLSVSQPEEIAGPTSSGAVALGVQSPPAAPVHAFWDRENLWLFSGIAVTRGMDYASTRNMQARGRKEILLAPEVVNNSAAFASLEAAGTMTSIGISYIFHRTGHHKLERWMSIGHISVTAFGDVRNYCLKSKHR